MGTHLPRDGEPFLPKASTEGKELRFRRTATPFPTDGTPFTEGWGAPFPSDGAPLPRDGKPFTEGLEPLCLWMATADYEHFQR